MLWYKLRFGASGYDTVCGMKTYRAFKAPSASSFYRDIARWLCVMMHDSPADAEVVIGFLERAKSGAEYVQQARKLRYNGVVAVGSTEKMGPFEAAQELAQKNGEKPIGEIYDAKIALRDGLPSPSISIDENAVFPDNSGVPLPQERVARQGRLSMGLTPVTSGSSPGGAATTAPTANGGGPANGAATSAGNAGTASSAASSPSSSPSSATKDAAAAAAPATRKDSKRSRDSKKSRVAAGASGSPNDSSKDSDSAAASSQVSDRLILGYLGMLFLYLGALLHDCVGLLSQ